MLQPEPDGGSGLTNKPAKEVCISPAYNIIRIHMTIVVVYYVYVLAHIHHKHFNCPN